jgi:SNF2 family DNA or RNA helicase
MEDSMIRKTREDIADQLPEIIHQLIPVPFDTHGATLYRTIATDLLHQLQQAMSKHGGSFNLWKHYNDPASNEAQGQIMSRLTVLRMLCDNPHLVSRSAAIYADPKRPNEGSAYAFDINARGYLSKAMDTPKLNAVVEYIEEVLTADPKNKVVLFSFFKENLRLDFPQNFLTLLLQLLLCRVVLKNANTKCFNKNGQSMKHSWMANTMMFVVDLT